MRVFVTGATGYVGARIVTELQHEGHDVVGLARSERSAHHLRERGIEVVRGDLRDLERLTPGIRGADAVIHTAFDHDLEHFAEAVQTEARAVQTFIAALGGSSKPLVVTSGTGVLGDTDTRVVDDDEFVTRPGLRGSAGIENEVLRAAQQGVRSVVIRLPLFVFGHAGSVFVPRLLEAARDHGVSPYVGTGENRFSAVHVDDAARAFVLALRVAPPGSLYATSSESGITARGIAEAVAENARVTAESVSRPRAETIWGAWLAGMMTINNQTSASRMKRELGWTARSSVRLLDDIRSGSYSTNPQDTRGKS